LALAECTAVTALYILLAFGGLRLADVSSWLHWLEPAQGKVISGFVVGAVSQLAAVGLIWLAFHPTDLARAVGAIGKSSTMEGWFIAVTIIVVESVTMYVFFLDVGWEAIGPSALNIVGSIAPLLDGVTQEVVFRGYVILRLARAGFGPVVQILFSSLAFSAIHVGYVGEGLSEALAPLLGTVGLGGALAWSFIRSGHSLRPTIFAHAAILVVVQPWLALAR